MLNVLRDNFKDRPYLKWILIIVAVSMVGYLGNFFFNSDQTGSREWAARVNGKEIPVSEFLNTARTMDEFYRKQFGPNYEQLRTSLQIGPMAMQALVEKELVLQDADNLGLSVSNQDLANNIRSNPNLRDESGQFIGLERYQAVIGRSVPGGVPAFEQSVADQLILERWTDLVTQPVTVSDDELRELYRRRNEKTGLRYIVVPSADQKLERALPDEEARRFYDEHQDRYQRAEGRRIRYVVVTRESQRAKVEMTPEELRAAYEANQAKYTHPEQRRAQHILFRLESGASEADKRRVRQQAEDALARARGGEDFATLAKSLSQDTGSAQRGGDVGFFGRSDMVGPFAEAAFNTPVGEITAVVEGPFGFHVIKVTDSRAAGTQPLEEVEADLRRSSELTRAQDLAQSEAQRLRAEMDSAEAMQKVAEREGLKTETRVFRKGERAGELGASPDFLNAIFSLELGTVSQPLKLASGVALLLVEETVPPAIAPFEEIEAEVQTDALNEKTRELALEAARRALAAHPSLDQAAAALKLQIRDSGELAPGDELPGTGGLTPELQVRLYGSSAQIGDRGASAVPAGAVLYEITSRRTFDAAQFEREKESLRAETLDARREQYRTAILTKLRMNQDVQYNRELLQRFAG